MWPRGKILSIIIKLLIGSGSVLILYYRLKSDLSPQHLEIIKTSAFSATGLLCLVFCFGLMLLNWGSEAYKWKIITAPVEKISYARATKSVFSGICLGNFAPGRATEFLAKILFFSPDARPKVTMLHFVGGMFQFSVTVVVGFMAVLLRVRDLGPEYSWIVYASAFIGLIMLSLLVFCILRVNRVLHFAVKLISRKKDVPVFEYKFTPGIVLRLFSFSVLRYSVFFSQMALLLFLFNKGAGLSVQMLSGISVYFLITATLPMFSVIEAAIRAAVGLLVFKNSGTPDSVIALCTVTLWFVNIVIPSLVGYYFLVLEKFDFKTVKLKT